MTRDLLVMLFPGTGFTKINVREVRCARMPGCPFRMSICRSIESASGTSQVLLPRAIKWLKIARQSTRQHKLQRADPTRKGNVPFVILEEEKLTREMSELMDWMLFPRNLRLDMLLLSDGLP